MKKLDAKNVFRGSTGKREALWAVRERCDPSQFASFFRWLGEQPSLTKKVFAEDLPKKASALLVRGAIGHLSLVGEIAWAVGVLSLHSEQLSGWAAASAEVGASLLAGSFEHCLRSLAQIERTFGASLWLIQNRIAILQQQSGLEAQKKYAIETQSQLPHSGLAAYICFYTSVRNEPTMSVQGFASALERQLSHLDAPKEYRAYIRHRLLPEFALRDDDARHILRVESTASLIDYYETFLWLARVAIADRGNGSLEPWHRGVRQLAQRIHDQRLTFMLAHAGSPVNMAVPPVKAFDCFLRGDYSTASLLAQNEEAASWANLELGALADAILENDTQEAPASFASLLRRDLARVFARGAKHGEVAALRKTALNYMSFRWAPALLASVRYETQSDPVVEHDAVHKVASVAIGPQTPMSILRGENPKDGYAELAALELGSSSVIGLPVEIAALLCSGSSLRRQDWNGAIKAASSLSVAQSRIFRWMAPRITSYAALQSGRVQEAAEICVGAAFAEPGIIETLPIIATAELLRDKEVRRTAGGALCMPILVDMAAKQDETRFAPLRVVAAEEFLRAQDVETPSQLRGKLVGFQKDQLVYFLRHVCVEAVLDSLVSATGSASVAEERLQVCQSLTELDPERKHEYHDEIRNITRRVFLQRRMREIDQSKIYVDLGGVSRKAHENLKESFTRFMALRAMSPMLAAMEEIESVLARAQSGDLEGLSRLEVPENEAQSLLEALVTRLRDEYVASADYGLDGYLSTRIRHGTLAGHLRRPLEDAHLVTQRDSVLQTYKPPTYWLSKLSERVDREEVSKRFATFAAAYDRYVRLLASEWVQVKVANDQTGLFDFIWTRRQVALLNRLMRPDTSFEEFLDDCLNHFAGQLERSLEVVRGRLHQEARADMTRMLQDFAYAVSTLLPGAHERDADVLRELMNSIRGAQTGVNVALDRMIEWFRPPPASADEPFALIDAVDIAVASVKTISRGIETKVTIDSPTELMFHGRVLADLVYILFTIFENVVRHSGRDEMPLVSVTGSVSETSAHLEIENEIAPEASSQEAQKRVARIREVLRSGAHLEAANREGGTGFYKIRRIIDQVFGERGTLEFGYRARKAFFVAVDLPLTRSGVE